MDTWMEYLADRVDPTTMARAQEAQRSGQDPVDVLLATVSPIVLLAAQSRHYNVPFIQLERYRADPDAVALLREELARKLCLLPLFVDNDSLYVALLNPDDLGVLDYLQQMTGLSIEPVLATRKDLEAALNRTFLTQEQTAKTMQVLAKKGEEERKETAAAPAVTTVGSSIRIEDSAAPAIQLVNYILGQAINMGASDIHLEAFPTRALLRYRVDGVLHEFPAPPLTLLKAMVSRFKIIGNMDVAERRLPQDGRASFAIGESEYDLRVSIIPNMHGEGVVVRILDTHGGAKTLESVGFEPDMLAQYKRLISKPHGILLVTGPTGAGKSTTLYATLQHIFTPKKKIITLEDPVEYFLDGVTQIPVHPAIGFTFASALRCVLRHDPDVVMLGEIRDAETAEIAIRASMTGHFVFSTLHTNDAPSSLARLTDMGIAPYLVMSSLSCVLAQRLLRRLCPKCKQTDSLSPEQMASLGLAGQTAQVYKPVGCSACNNLGYKGRVAIYELLEISPQLRRLGSQAVTAHEVREVATKVAAESNGQILFRTLRDSALMKLSEGLVSVEDLVALTMEED